LSKHDDDNDDEDIAIFLKKYTIKEPEMRKATDEKNGGWKAVKYCISSYAIAIEAGAWPRKTGINILKLHQLFYHKMPP
jgi:hypothetical protein